MLTIEMPKPFSIIGRPQFDPYLDTWTPEEASLLVSGIDPQLTISHDEGTGKDRVIVYKSMLELFNEPHNSFACVDLFTDAARVLNLWNSRKNRPAELCPIDFVAWCETKNINTDWITNTDEWKEHVAAQTPEKRKTSIPKERDTNEENKPWLTVDPEDPAPKYPWYTPARFFARQLVKDDSTLLTKRDLLSNKIAKSLTDVGIKNRSKKNFSPATIKKALSNLSLG